MFAAVESNVTSQTCKQKGGFDINLGGVLTILGCDRRLFCCCFFVLFCFFKEPGVKMDSDSIYDQHKMTALMFDRKTRYKS